MTKKEKSLETEAALFAARKVNLYSRTVGAAVQGCASPTRLRPPHPPARLPPPPAPLAAHRRCPRQRRPSLDEEMAAASRPSSHPCTSAAMERNPSPPLRLLRPFLRGSPSALANCQPPDRRGTVQGSAPAPPPLPSVRALTGRKRILPGPPPAPEADGPKHLSCTTLHSGDTGAHQEFNSRGLNFTMLWGHTLQGASEGHVSIAF